MRNRSHSASVYHMYEALTHTLRCTGCGGTLALEHARQDQSGEILSGALRCQNCGSTYPVYDGIVDMLGAARITSLAQLTNELPPTAWAYERLWRPFALSLLSGQALPYSHELALVLRMAGPERGLFLDVACSNGLYARALARRLGAHGHVAGIDHSMTMLREARRRARAEGLRISYVRARAQRLPFQSAGAMGLVVGGSLNEAGDLDGCLGEIRRVLAPGRPYVAMTLTTHPRWFERTVQRALAPGGIRFWSAGELIEHFERHDLHVAEREQFGIVLFTRALAG